ncbi:MAG: beta-Ig-H3/fasciclin [Candidatus Saccharibacteria bacterium]|nr:beta-Ig-H3/fasciclin [Candidatus Saccharibacteria bacterium]
MEPTNNTNKPMMGAVIAIAALIIGMGGGYAIGHGMKSDTKSASSTAMTTSDAKDGVTVGGAKMVSSLDIVDNAVHASNVTTVVAAVKAAGLVDTLKSPGPFTVFAPNNDAFAKLPAGTVDTLLKTENLPTLKKILSYHVVAGTYTSADLRVMASKGESLTTVEGEMLTPVVVNNELKMKDAKGVEVGIQTADIISSNGVTHVIDTVFSPAS